MKNKIALLFLSLSLLTSSCSTSQFGAVATGSSLGGMFGSSIGSLMGGWRGSNKGTIAGMVIGGAVGAAATAPKKDRAAEDNYRNDYDENYDQYDSAYESSDSRSCEDRVQYGSYNSPECRRSYTGSSNLEDVRLMNIHFIDANDNECLDKNEEAFIVLDIKNRGEKTVYNITPLITCDNSRVVISPAATISSLRPHKAVRYKAMVRSYRKLGKDPLKFKVEFKNSQYITEAGDFSIRTH